MSPVAIRAPDLFMITFLRLLKSSDQFSGIYNRQLGLIPLKESADMRALEVALVSSSVSLLSENRYACQRPATVESAVSNA